MPQSQSLDGLLPVAESGGQTGKAVTGVPGAEGTADHDGREDLTAFFTIGVIVDVFLVTAFLFWAVRQWRKAKK